MELEEGRQHGAKMWQQMLGEEQAEDIRQVWRDICPDFEAYVVEFVGGEIWQRPGLDRRTKSLVTLAAVATQGRPLALELNIRMALRNGATRQEIVETFLQLAPYSGFPCCWEGLTVARKVFRELDQSAASKAREG